MAWTIDAVIIHPGDQGDQHHVEALYAFQNVLDATADTISWFGARSTRRTLRFILFEDENGGTGLSSLKTKVRTNADVTLTSDQGSQGNHRMLSLRASRRQDHANASPVYECTTELIES